MRRWGALGIVAVIGVATLVLVGPARLRPWQCHDVKTAGSARAAYDAYYSSCWNAPTLQAGIDDRAGSKGGAGEQYLSWARLFTFRVRYGDGRVAFLQVGQRAPNGGWRVLQGEGTGP